MWARSDAPRPAGFWSTVFLRWDQAEQLLVGVLGFLAILVGVVQVLGRYVDPHNAISYAEEVIVYLLIWAVMISSSQLVRSDGHVRPDLVLRLVSPRTQRVLELVNCLVAIGFCVGLVTYGWQIVDTALMLDEHSSTDLQFPMAVYYLTLPVGSGLMLIRYVIRFVRFAFLYDPATMAIGHALAHDRPLDMQTPAVD